MLKNSYLLSLLLTTHILGISAFDLKAAQQSNAVREADDGTSSSAQMTSNLTPSGGIVTVIENVTVTTCPKHNVTPTSTTSSPTLSSTPCNIMSSIASLIPTTNAAQQDSTTVYTTTSASTTSYSCSTGWVTSTYTFTTTKTKTKTCTDEPLATADTLAVSSPVSTNTYVVYNSTDTTPTLASTLPCATANVYNYTMTLTFEPHPTFPSPTGSEERNVGSKDAILEALGLTFIGYLAWLIVVL